MVFDPLAVDRDVALEEMETRLRQQRGNAIGLDIHPMDFPVGGGDDSPGQMMADEAVDAEYENTFHLLNPRRRCGSASIVTLSSEGHDCAFETCQHIRRIDRSAVDFQRADRQDSATATANSDSPVANVECGLARSAG